MAINSYLEGGGGRIVSLRPAHAKLTRLSPKQNKNKRAGILAQVAKCLLA
jgi:hypothetical protein